jgi:hypothetical protein
VRSREARFIGHGNFTQGEGHCRINAWRLTCSQCRDIKVIAMPHGDLPPNLLIKKFGQAGWMVGKRATGDLCDGCQKKNKRSVSVPVPLIERTTDAIAKHREAVAALQIARTMDNEHHAKLIEIAQHRVEQFEALLKEIHAMLCAGKVDAVRLAIESHLPNLPNRAAPPPSVIIKRDDAFDEWLNILEKDHRARSRR